MGMILDRLQTELEKTRKDGKHRRLHVDRNKFLIEVPGAMHDPRFQLMGTNRPTVIIEFEKNEHITAGELLELCSRDPENPLSLVYRSAVLGLDTEHVLAVRQDQLDQLRAKQAIAVSRGGRPEPDENGVVPEEASGVAEEPRPVEGFTPESALAAVEAGNAPTSRAIPSSPTETAVGSEEDNTTLATVEKANESPSRTPTPSESEEVVIIENNNMRGLPLT